MERVRATYKKRDAWWTVLLVDPSGNIGAREGQTILLAGSGGGPVACVWCRDRPGAGHISTSNVEPQNVTMRILASVPKRHALGLGP